jgi:hypothetical protein
MLLQYVGQRNHNKNPRQKRGNLFKGQKIMHEVTQNTFHKLQTLAEGGFLDKITGPLTIKRSSQNPENITYLNSRGKWLQRFDGMCFAHKTLILFLQKLEKKS